MKERFETERLILRHWNNGDAEELYRYAKDERVGPPAGWPVHTSVENSREIIEKEVLAEGTYAVVLKESNLPVGTIGLLLGGASDLVTADTEAEIGYWIGVPYWGQGFIPEAARVLIQYAFDELGMDKLWCGYFEGNDKSLRVQQKCGFVYHHTNENISWPLMGDIRTEHITCLTKQQWIEKDMVKSDQNELLLNLHRLHTTELGIERIRTNLCIQTEDVIGWCREKIRDTGSSVTRRGKNWYISSGDCIITVNANSFTVITAHKRK